MKKYLLTFTALITASTAYALDCATPPSCAELGYTDTVANCTDAIKCPFDTTLGKCVSSATVGQIGYFPKAPSGNWVLCDGRFLSSAMYPELSNYLGITFGGTSSNGMFAVPDYRGDFVRVYGGSSGGTTTRQAEGLPNIKGGTIPVVRQANNPTGVFVSGSTWNTGIRGGGDSDTWGMNISFNASYSNPIYGASSHVTPVNTAVYAYIYAGRIDTTAATAKSKLGTSCSKGQYYYTDGTCSSSYSSSKTLKGVVYNTYTSDTSYSYIYYYFGGGSTVSSYEAAVNKCKEKAGGSHLTPASVVNIIPSGATYSNAYAPVTNRDYWWGKGEIATCTSTTSCTSYSYVTSGNYYYYCSAYDYFY